jgi:exodeoxyribonuclease-5
LELTRKQEEGLKLAVARYKNGEPWTCIAGYAGTGKSTLVKFIIAALDIDEQDDVCYVAYTGKAANVLKEKGCPNSMTAHRLLYQSVPRNDGTFYHKIKRPLEYRYKLIVVDEISMLPKEMWELLLSHKIPVLCLGDPFQLPPIGEDNGVLATPHIFLDEIMRQAEESEIIRLTMDIRNGKPLELFKGNEVQVIDQKNIVGGMYGWADQILVAKNITRRVINNQMRKMLFDTEDTKPVEGDKIICLRNDWDHPSAAGDIAVNGTIGTISNIRYKHNIPCLNPMMIADFLPESYTEADAAIALKDVYFRDINMDYKLLTTGEETVTKENFKTFPKIWRPQTYDYAYAITCHKSQGSEYDKVLVFEEFLKGDEHARWLYTAATRAKKKLIIVRNFK